MIGALGKGMLTIADGPEMPSILVCIADQLDTSVDYLTGRIEEPQNVR